MLALANLGYDERLSIGRTLDRLRFEVTDANIAKVQHLHNEGKRVTAIALAKVALQQLLYK